MMTKSKHQLLTECRKRLQDPYALIEHLNLDETAPIAASAAEISASRELLQLPYAHLGEAGTYEALAPATSRPTPSPPYESRARSATPSEHAGRPAGPAWSNQEIEAKVREIHGLIWQKRAELFPDGVPGDPVQLLDPAIALRWLGFDFRYEEGLGQMPGKSGPIEIGGLINNSTKQVRVARQFSPAVRSFTAAHELGHAVLHAQHLSVLHQDKPLDGVNPSRSRIEVEAKQIRHALPYACKAGGSPIHPAFQGHAIRADRGLSLRPHGQCSSWWSSGFSFSAGPRKASGWSGPIRWPIDKATSYAVQRFARDHGHSTGRAFPGWRLN